MTKPGIGGWLEKEGTYGYEGLHLIFSAHWALGTDGIGHGNGKWEMGNGKWGQERGVSGTNGRAQMGGSGIAKCSLCHGHALLMKDCHGRT